MILSNEQIFPVINGRDIENNFLLVFVIGYYMLINLLN